jgi:predicted secreted hydrolase
MSHRLSAIRRRFPLVNRHHPPRWVPAIVNTLFLVALLLLSACGTPMSATDGKAAWPGPFTPPNATPTVPPPVNLPADESPHDDLTEWWYYTGHLLADDGTRYGFESVIFQSRRSTFAPIYSAHIAVTDHARQKFTYDQKIGTAQVGTGPGFNLQMESWAWRGSEGRDAIAGNIPGYTFALDLVSTKPPVLHEGGYIDYGPAGSTYYYSRTRMAITGTLEDNGTRKTVTGDAWFDHQWGNFFTVSTGGWDWFSAHLDDGSDFTVYLIRSEGQQIVGSLGTFVDPDGRATNIPFENIKVDVLGTWTSPRTGVTYPSGWRVTLTDRNLVLTWTPVIPDQELDTRRSTANIYWEGAVIISGTRNGTSITGQGYVELTGYDQK